MWVFPLPEGERVASHRVAPSAPNGKLREPVEGRSEFQSKLIEPLTPSLSPTGRGGAGAADASDCDERTCGVGSCQADRRPHVRGKGSAHRRVAHVSTP